MTVHVSVTGPELLQHHQRVNQYRSAHQENKKDGRFDRLHCLSDHCLSEWVAVLLATEERLSRGTDVCWCG